MAAPLLLSSYITIAATMRYAPLPAPVVADVAALTCVPFNEMAPMAPAYFPIDIHMDRTILS
jgi:hypothetical protein